MLSINSEVVCLGSNKFALRLYAFHIDHPEKVLQAVKVIYQNTRAEYKELIREMSEQLIDGLLGAENEKEPEAE